MSRSLDAVRGLMALLVALHHVRNNFMPQIDQPINNHSALTFIFRFFTGLGRGPVIIFFVLSGFWISKVVIERFIKKGFDWRIYLVERLLRLQIVLLPILLIQFFFILLFSHLNIDEIFKNIIKLIGNAFFLQSYVGYYGGNLQLWSLQYEFWYYILFPACIIVIVSKNLIVRMLNGVVIALILWIFSFDQDLYFSIWLIGCAVYLILSNKKIWHLGEWPKYLSPKLMGVILILLALINGRFMTVSKYCLYRYQYVEDLITALIAGLAFLLLSVDEKHDDKSQIHMRVVNKFIYWLSLTSSFSYTLYIIHFPILQGINVVAFQFLDQFKVINLKNILLALGIWVAIVFLSYLYSRVTEVHYKNMKNKWISILNNRLFLSAKRT